MFGKIISISIGGIIAAGALFGAVGANAPSPLPRSVVVASTYVPGDESAPADTLTMPKGTLLQFTNGDAISHSLTSRSTVRQRRKRVPRFTTGVVRSGSGVPVVGTAELRAGRYRFRCVIHPDMAGVLVVQ